MKVLLLNPPYLPYYSRQSRSPCVTKSGTLYYPYFLAYTTGILDELDFDTKLLDAVVNNLSHEETIKEVKKFNPDLIVIETSTPSIKNDISIAKKIKRALPKSHVNLLGVHATALPAETLKEAGIVDSICRGEYEYTVRDLAIAIKDKKSLNKILGLSFKRKNKITHNKPRPLLRDIDKLPFVSKVYKKHFGKEGIKKYFYSSLRWPQVTILTARGCPHNCTFCNSPFKGSYRPRSPENVVKEFQFIKKELPFVKEIMIEDETFPALKRRTIKICKLLIKKKVKLNWSCNARVDTDLETLKIMKRAGARLLCVGFESVEQKSLDAIGKGTSKHIQNIFIKNIRKAKLLVNGCFILGLPGETKEDIQRTIEFAKKLNPDTAQFYPLMVYPGTAAYEWAKKQKYIKTEDYSKWLTKEGHHNTVVSRSGLSNKELVALCDLARKNFYLRASYLIPKIAQIISNPQEAKRTLKSGKTFFPYMKKVLLKK
ncbi:MAG: radical SAM protein [archaeon]|nr:MAG: radical SAM protein [archaeon]